MTSMDGALLHNEHEQIAHPQYLERCGVLRLHGGTQDYGTGAHAHKSAPPPRRRHRSCNQPQFCLQGCLCTQHPTRQSSAPCEQHRPSPRCRRWARMRRAAKWRRRRAPLRCPALTRNQRGDDASVPQRSRQLRPALAARPAPPRPPLGCPVSLAQPVFPSPPLPAPVAHRPAPCTSQHPQRGCHTARPAQRGVGGDRDWENGVCAYVPDWDFCGAARHARAHALAFAEGKSRARSLA
mmetsp:Transcript_31884/g.74281  ORF Transcript_31884/g.74281 Transcript_31884/m.74281 type:complete len:238 (-) Transcript_31884:197-910(-)